MNIFCSSIKKKLNVLLNYYEIIIELTVFKTLYLRVICCSLTNR